MGPARQGGAGGDARALVPRAESRDLHHHGHAGAPVFHHFITPRQTRVVSLLLHVLLERSPAVVVAVGAAASASASASSSSSSASATQPRGVVVGMSVAVAAATSASPYPSPAGAVIGAVTGARTGVVC